MEEGQQQRVCITEGTVRFFPGDPVQGILIDKHYRAHTLYGQVVKAHYHVVPVDPQDMWTCCPLREFKRYLPYDESTGRRNMFAPFTEEQRAQMERYITPEIIKAPTHALKLVGVNVQKAWWCESVLNFEKDLLPGNKPTCMGSNFYLPIELATWPDKSILESDMVLGPQFRQTPIGRLVHIRHFHGSLQQTVHALGQVVGESGNRNPIVRIFGSDAVDLEHVASEQTEDARIVIHPEHLIQHQHMRGWWAPFPLHRETMERFLIFSHPLDYVKCTLLEEPPTWQLSPPLYLERLGALHMIHNLKRDTVKRIVRTDKDTYAFSTIDYYLSMRNINTIVSDIPGMDVDNMEYIDDFAALQEGEVIFVEPIVDQTKKRRSSPPARFIRSLRFPGFEEFHKFVSTKGKHPSFANLSVSDIVQRCGGLGTPYGQLIAAYFTPTFESVWVTAFRLKI